MWESSQKTFHDVSLLQHMGGHSILRCHSSLFNQEKYVSWLHGWVTLCIYTSLKKQSHLCPIHTNVSFTSRIHKTDFLFLFLDSMVKFKVRSQFCLVLLCSFLIKGRLFPSAMPKELVIAVWLQALVSQHKEGKVHPGGVTGLPSSIWSYAYKKQSEFLIVCLSYIYVF